MRNLCALALALIAFLSAPSAHAAYCNWNIISQSNPSQTLDFGTGNWEIMLYIDLSANCTGTPESPLLNSPVANGDPNPTINGIAPDSSNFWGGFDAPLLGAYGETYTNGETGYYHFSRYAIWNTSIFKTALAGTYNLSMSLEACVGSDCQTFPISADIIINSYCDISTVTQRHIDFGFIGGANIENVASTTGLLTTKCSEANGGNYSITLSGGNSYNGTRNMTNGGYLLPYELLYGGVLWDPGVEVTVPGDGVSHDTEVGARTVPTGASLLPGIYTDTVVVTVTY